MNLGLSYTWSAVLYKKIPVNKVRVFCTKVGVIPLWIIWFDQICVVLLYFCFCCIVVFSGYKGKNSRKTKALCCVQVCMSSLIAGIYKMKHASARLPLIAFISCILPFFQCSDWVSHCAWMQTHTQENINPGKDCPANISLITEEEIKSDL